MDDKCQQCKTWIKVLQHDVAHCLLLYIVSWSTNSTDTYFDISFISLFIMSTDKYKRLDNVLLHCATLCYILLDCASSCAIFCMGQHDATLICMNFAKFCYIVLHFAWDNMIQMLSSLAWQHDTKLCSIVLHCATLCFIDVLHFAWGQHDATLIICGWQHRDPRLEALCYIVLHSIVLRLGLVTNIVTAPGTSSISFWGGRI